MQTLHTGLGFNGGQHVGGFVLLMESLVNIIDKLLNWKWERHVH